jgi:putative ABC transport system permease protein
MNFSTVVLRGLVRRPVRTGLTLLGIGVGIAAVVALVGISRGFDKSWDSGMKARHTDIVVSNMGSALTPKPFTAEVRDRVAQVPGVSETCMLLVELMSVEDAQMMMVSSREWGGYTWQNLKVLQGRLPNDPKEQAVVLGPAAAEVLRKKVGDKLQLEAAELTIVGIVDGGAWVENGSVILGLPLFQELTGNEGKINIVDVRAKGEQARPQIDELCRRINTVVPEGRAMPAGDHIGQSQGYKIAKAMTWGTSLLAVLVGVLGVMNTMLMTVFERKQELSILLAIGWKRTRIMHLILYESALLGFFGGLVGIVVGVLGVRLLVYAPSIHGLLQPDVSFALLSTSLAIAVAVGVLSGLYPAWRSSRISPSLAMQGG